MASSSQKAGNGKPWALVTGASEGLGAEFALQIAKRTTHNIILTARTESKLQALAKRLSEYGILCQVITADLSTPNSASELNKKTEGYNVALFVNNAGIAEGGDFEHMDFDVLQKLISVNVVAFAELFHTFLPRVKAQVDLLKNEQKKTRFRLTGIINLSSTAAFMPIPSMAAYAASKVS
jgi:hypothetical protein